MKKTIRIDFLEKLILDSKNNNQDSLEIDKILLLSSVSENTIVKVDRSKWENNFIKEANDLLRKNFKLSDSDKYFDISIDKNNKLTIFEPCGNEIDENLDSYVEMNDWDSLLETYNKKYSIKLSEPVCYWSK